VKAIEAGIENRAWKSIEKPASYLIQQEIKLSFVRFLDHSVPERDLRNRWNYSQLKSLPRSVIRRYHESHPP
jgi:hypothetical protein